MADTPVKTISLATREKISLSKTKYTKDYLRDKGLEYINGILSAPKEDKRIPTVVGYCLHAGISRSRLYELIPVYPEVADTVEYIEMLQEQAAIEGGMSGKMHPIFSMFLLKSKHGYKDQPQQLTQNNTFNVSPDLLADALALMKANKGKK